MNLDPSLDKEKIAASFSRSAPSYDSFNDIQLRLAKELAEMAGAFKFEPTSILDIGTGTGEVAFLLNQRFPNAKIIGCDIAQGMIKKAKARNTSPNIKFEVADAEALPYNEDQFDLVVSNSTFQWVGNIVKAFSNVKRILKEDHPFVFITFGPKTFSELGHAFKLKVDSTANYLHTYRTIEELERLLTEDRFEILESSSEIVKQMYPSCREMFKTIKGVGALNASKDLPKGMKSRSKLEAMIHYYEDTFKMGDNVYATYEVIKVSARCCP
jgi:malonyl-CoA O-methyltransferase